MTASFRGRLGLQQRVLPDYRVPFFDLLAASCEAGMSIFAGQPRADEGILTGTPGRARYSSASNLHILRGPLYLCHQPGITDWLEEWNPDALIMEANPRYLATARGVQWMHVRHRPAIGWGLGAPQLHGLVGGIREGRRRRFLSQFDALIAYSQRGAREYVDAGFPSQQVFVAANAVAPRPSRPPDHKTHARQPTVLFVGRLQPRKHVDFLIRACAASPEPRPRLLIVGDGPERARLESLARQVYAATEFAGARHGDELETYFLQADLFVLPGTGGLAVQQAMAHGLPVIVAKGDGTQDDLVRDGNGWQIPPEDYTALLQTLRLALADAGKLRKMGAESFRIVSEEINLESMVAAFVSALNASR